MKGCLQGNVALIGGEDSMASFPQTGLAENPRGSLADGGLGEMRRESRVCCYFGKRVPAPTADLLGLGNQLDLRTWKLRV